MILISLTLFTIGSVLLDSCPAGILTSALILLVLTLSPLGIALGIGHSQSDCIAQPAGVDREDPQFEVGNSAVSDDARQEVYEIPIYILGVKSNKLLLRREAPAIPPNYFVRNLESGEEQQVSPCLLSCCS